MLCLQIIDVKEAIVELVQILVYKVAPPHRKTAGPVRFGTIESINVEARVRNLALGVATISQKGPEF